MKILSIGSDDNLFGNKSESAQRIAKYWSGQEEVYIIVFCLKNEKVLAPVNFGNIFIYSTNSWTRIFYIFDAWRLARKLGQFNIITCQDPFETGLAGWLIARRVSAKLELQIHTDFLSPYFSQESFLNKFRVLLSRFLLPRADKVRVVSQRITNSIKTAKIKLKSEPEIRAVFVDKEKIINTPIKADLHQKYPQFDKIILMASRLTKVKNIGLAIEAMAEVVKNKPKVGLVIVGSGPEELKLKLEVKSLELENCIIFESWTDDLSSYYKTADIFLNTSFYEGYGRTLVEATICGIVTLSTDVGVARDLPIEVIDFSVESVVDKLVTQLNTI